MTTLKAGSMAKPKKRDQRENVHTDSRETIYADERIVIEPTFTITPPPTEPTIMTGTEIDEPIVLPKPRVSSFVPRPCSTCEAWRPKGTNYSRVETTRGNVRYCRCGFCGDTFKQSE